jgi:hypothetical protein
MSAQIESEFYYDYAKQTQFPKSPNECKLTYNKGLKKKRCFRSPKKQTQFKPNQTQSNPISVKKCQQDKSKGVLL